LFEFPLKRYGLIGYPLGHSFSEQYFAAKFAREGIVDAQYNLFPLENLALLPDLLQQNPTLQGLNVTIPYKEKVIPYCYKLDEIAQAIGAVNCLKKVSEQQWVGYNTDAIGFEQSLLRLNGGQWLSGPHLQAYILGTGGASKAVAYVLQKHQIPVTYISRNPRQKGQISYKDLSPSHFSANTLLIQTTPLGTHPNTEEMPPISPTLFYPGMLVYDLIYNPAETLLLREAKSHECTVMNGLEMLTLQAEAAWDIWQV